jgi:hypothetical protein
MRCCKPNYKVILHGQRAMQDTSPDVCTSEQGTQRPSEDTPGRETFTFGTFGSVCVSDFVLPPPSLPASGCLVSRLRGDGPGQR